MSRPAKPGKSPGQSGNDRNMKGNNFVTAGQIWQTATNPEKVGKPGKFGNDDIKVFHGRTNPEIVGKSGKNPEMTGT